MAPYISYLDNAVTYNSITLSAISNVRADVFNYTVVHTPDYAYPTLQVIQTGTPVRVRMWARFHHRCRARSPS